jgi:hypothetical protein
VALQLLCVALAGLIAAMIVVAGWWSGTHCARCGSACFERRARQRKAAREMEPGGLRARTI